MIFGEQAKVGTFSVIDYRKRKNNFSRIK